MKNYELRAANLLSQRSVRLANLNLKKLKKAKTRKSIAKALRTLRSTTRRRS